MPIRTLCSTVLLISYSIIAVAPRFLNIFLNLTLEKEKLRAFSPQANYTDRATAACRRS
jgi:hypothetical protein